MSEKLDLTYKTDEELEVMAQQLKKLLDDREKERQRKAQAEDRERKKKAKATIRRLASEAGLKVEFTDSQAKKRGRPRKVEKQGSSSNANAVVESVE